MVVSTDGNNPALHAAVVDAVRGAMAHHPSIALENVDARAPFPRQGYLEYNAACADLLRQRIAYVLDIDVSAGGNGGLVCTRRKVTGPFFGKGGQEVCASYETRPYTQTTGSYVVRTIDTSTCQQPRHWHSDSVLVTGPEATSRPGAEAALAASLASSIDAELPP